MADGTNAAASQPGAIWRAVAALVAVVASFTTTLLFLFVAIIGAVSNGEDGRPVGSRWAPGAWGSIVQLWGLAVPAVIVALGLVWAVAAGRRWMSLSTWAAMTGLLIAWCVFTGVSAVPVDLSGTNSHWMWLAGLLVACGGGLAGVGIPVVGSRASSSTSSG